MTQADRLDCARLLSSPRDLATVACRAEAGELFVYPTETLYGIGGRCDREDVRARLVEAKSRGVDTPLILVAAARTAFSSLDIEFPAGAERLAQRFWPGRLTLVLPRRGTDQTVGIRVSDHPFIVALARLAPFPLFSTSANLSGESYVGDPDQIYRTFLSRVNFMVDAGCLPESRPSTVVSVDRDERVEVIRAGAVAESEILGALVRP